MEAVAENDCFGKEWDMSVRPCQVCADNEVCGILFGEVVKKKVADVEARNVPMLDKADLSLIDDEETFKLMCDKTGVLTVEELIEFLKQKSRLDDEVALVEWVKAFRLRCNKGFKITDGIVYVDRTYIR